MSPRAKKRRAPRAGSRRSQRAERPALETLSPPETQVVLARLLAAHPELTSEVQEIAKSMLASVSAELLADEVENALTSVGIEDLGGRAGRHEWGYVEPNEAAGELLEEALEPFLADLKRHIELELEIEALEIVKGILIGLYRIRDAAGDVLEWVPDFPEDAAMTVVEAWETGRGTKRAGRRRRRLLLPHEFVEKALPEWREFLRRERG